MEAWDKFANKVTETGNQAAYRVKGSGEQKKLESDIKLLKNRLNDEYFVLGKNVYQDGVKNPDKSVRAYADGFSRITELLTEIDEKNKDLENLKKRSVCPNCGKALPLGTNFCPFCGINLDEAIKKAEEEQKLRRYCSKCGTLLEKDAKFCVHCGAPVKIENQQDIQVKESSRETKEILEETTKDKSSP